VQPYSNYFIKQIPALRFLLPLIMGILLQYHFNIGIASMLIIAVFSGVFVLFFSLLSTSNKFNLAWAKGLLITILFIAIGGCLSYTKNASNRAAFIGNYFTSATPIIVTLQENIAAKEKSYKALASVEAVYKNKVWQQVEGDVLLYFKKDSTMPNLKYGSQILINKNLVGIVNGGNPGGFNYAEYCSFQNIYYQGFLKDDGLQNI
jgi:competence protein ComEC